MDFANKFIGPLWLKVRNRSTPLVIEIENIFCGLHTVCASLCSTF